MSAEADLVITRRFEASREKLWEAWTECEQVKRWWGPSGYVVEHCQIELRVGGSYLISMRAPDGRAYWSTGTYRDIATGARIVSTDSFADEQGHIVSPARYGFGPDFPRELLLIVTFEERDGATELTVRHRGVPLGEDYGNTRVGWSQSLRKLAEVLEPVGAGRR